MGSHSVFLQVVTGTHESLVYTNDSQPENHGATRACIAMGHGMLPHVVSGSDANSWALGVSVRMSVQRPHHPESASVTSPAAGSGGAGHRDSGSGDARFESIRLDSTSARCVAGRIGDAHMF